MNPTRRGFLKLTGTGGLILSTGGAAVLLDACNAQTVFETIISWIPTAKSAFQGIVTILGPFLPPGAQALITEVFAALDVVTAAVNEYLNAPAADKATFLGKLRVALTAVGDQIQAFLAAFKATGNPLISVVLGLAQIIISTIEGFLGKIPLPAGAKVRTVRASIHFEGVTAVVVPKVRSISQFKKDFNSVCEANGQTSIELQ